MRIVFTWAVLSGYMAACWRELAARPGVDLHVIAARAVSTTNTDFSDTILQGVPHTLLDAMERHDGQLLIKQVRALEPDIIFCTGWWQKSVRDVALSKELSHIPFVMGLDTPWRSPVQYLNRLRFPRYLRRLTAVMPAGERAWQHARNLGTASNRIFRGQYGVDVSGLRPLYKQRTAGPWPRRFLFTGRYVPEKALDVLVKAYRIYRTKVTEPWLLRCCGRGPQGHLLENQPGIENVGFVQPEDMPAYWKDAGAFLIPSRFDPWPLALVEACAAGLPIIATEVCGSAVECLRPHYNGLFVSEEDPEALARAMITLHNQHVMLPIWGQRSQAFAEPYSAEIWADRIIDVTRQLVNKTK